MTRIGIVGMYISQHETIPCSISIIDLPVMYACIRFLKFRAFMTPTSELGRSGGFALSLWLKNQRLLDAACHKVDCPKISSLTQANTLLQGSICMCEAEDQIVRPSVSRDLLALVDLMSHEGLCVTFSISYILNNTSAPNYGGVLEAWYLFLAYFIASRNSFIASSGSATRAQMPEAPSTPCYPL